MLISILLSIERSLILLEVSAILHLNLLVFGLVLLFIFAHLHLLVSFHLFADNLDFKVFGIDLLFECLFELILNELNVNLVTGFQILDFFDAGL